MPNQKLGVPIVLAAAAAVLIYAPTRNAILGLIHPNRGPVAVVIMVGSVSTDSDGAGHASITAINETSGKVSDFSARCIGYDGRGAEVARKGVVVTAQGPLEPGERRAIQVDFDLSGHALAKVECSTADVW